MKVKKKWFVIIPLFVAVILFLGMYFYFEREDENSFTAQERNWIKKNSDKILDFEIISNYPVFGENNVFSKFIDDFSIDTSIEFNVIPYLKESVSNTTGYRFRLVNSSDPLGELDLLLHEDSYVAITKDLVQIASVLDFKNMKIGIFSTDSGEVSYYLKTATNVSYKPYETIEELTKALDEDEVGMIVIPGIMYLNDIFSNEKFSISYVFTEFSKRLVLTLDKNNSGMNKIVRKYFYNWKDKKFVKAYNECLLNYYVISNQIVDKDKTSFLTKTYTYGYVENRPYENLDKNKFRGIAAEYINRVTRLAGSELFVYKKYKNIEELKTAVGNGEVDIYFNYFDYEAEKFMATISPFVEKYVVLGQEGGSEVVNSFESLKGQKVSIIEGNAVYNYFKDNSKANITNYDSLEKMIKENKDSLFIVDKEIYNYYRTSKFSRYEVLYEDYITNDYNFMIKKEDTTVFYDMFNYIMSANSYYRYRNVGITSLRESLVEKSTFEELYIILLLVILVPLIVLMTFYVLLKRSKQVKRVKKEERRKYTDMLTSLKNRNYLNLYIKQWNESKKFPKSVIVIDLNNVKYVNDNHGYEAGDDLITEAASVLVSTQLENSEIIRTDGNEFLIYLVGYSEQQISTYAKKLSKELKNLEYGFGAAIGYSMIVDEIKTIDDATNEATLEMRRDKEEYK